MQRDDTLLTDLAQLARQQEEESRRLFDDRWDALAAGKASADEQRVLLREARANDSARLAHEAFRPLGEEFQSKVVERIRVELGHSDAPPSLAPVVPLKVTEHSDTEVPRRLPSSVHVWKPWAIAATVLLAVGALLVGVPNLQEQQALPGYQLILDGMTQELRSGEGSTETELPVFDTGNRLSLTLQPEQALSYAVEPRFFILRDGLVSPWSPPWQQAESGAIRITGQIGAELDLQPGDQQLIVALGRASMLPNLKTVQRQIDQDHASRDWILLRQSVHIRSGD